MSASRPRGRRDVRRAAAAIARAAAAIGLAAGLLLPGPHRAAAQGELKDAYLRRFVGKPAPDFTLKDLKGREVKLSDQKGKVVLLNYWYTGCFPCRRETPDLIRLYNAHKERGLVVLGINLDGLLMPADDGQMVQRFVEDFAIPYPTLIADAKMYGDYGKPVIAPLSLLIDRKGTIAQVFWGAYSLAAYQTAIGPYLDASGP